MRLRVTSLAYEAKDILSVELRWASTLPPFKPGAHIDVSLPNGLSRSYSLINPQEERHRYVVAVRREPDSRGASSFIHQVLRLGQIVEVREPRNHFSLDEGARHSLLIAGGIGITPLWCMVQRLSSLGRSCCLHYCARSRDAAAFLAPLERLAAGGSVELHLHFSREAGGRRLDIAGAVDRADADTHLYCCGPRPMIETFERAATRRPQRFVHVEHFTPRATPAADGSFSVVLARSGIRIDVPKGRTILDALLDEGIDPPHSCKEGMCGTCEVPVLQGIPDHRDLVLSKAQQESNRSMLICCSGSKTEEITIDL
jgi:ferredoxin-NADP reductase